jgi:two-component system, chemotaxis family, chemotaxis protein CheY
MRALVVDDDDAFRTLVVALLADLADVVEQAADGQILSSHTTYVPI